MQGRNYSNEAEEALQYLLNYIVSCDSPHYCVNSSSSILLAVGIYKNCQRAERSSSTRTN